MPLYVNGEKVVTAHGSKKSKVKLIFFEAHTSVLVPLLLIPVFPFGITVKLSLLAILILILLERRGITLGVAYKKIKSSLSGRYRYSKTRHRMIRRIKLNKQS
jgi:hypothetical protein